MATILLALLLGLPGRAGLAAVAQPEQAVPPTSAASDDGMSGAQPLDEDGDDAENGRDQPYWSDERKVIFFREQADMGYEVETLRALWFKPRPPFSRLGRRPLNPPVRNCDELATALAGRPLTVPLYRQVFDEYLTCIDSSLYGREQRPKNIPFDLAQLAQDVFRHLDAGSVPWSLGRRSHHKGPFRLTEVPFTTVEFDRGQLSMILGKRLYVLSLNSGSDFLGDGRMQILAVWTDRALGPNDYHEAAILLTRERKGGPIVARPITLHRPPSFTPPAPATPGKW